MPFCWRTTKELGPVIRRDLVLLQLSNKLVNWEESLWNCKWKTTLATSYYWPFVCKEKPQAHNFTKEWKQTTDIARAYLEKVSKHMKRWADRKRRPIKFWTGDQVLIKLRLEQIWFWSRKDQHLVRKYEGPVEVLKKIRNASYRMALPA